VRYEEKEKTYIPKVVAPPTIKKRLRNYAASTTNSVEKDGTRIKQKAASSALSRGDSTIIKPVYRANSELEKKKENAKIEALYEKLASD
jgi:hypothetical protein